MFTGLSHTHSLLRWILLILLLLTVANAKLKWFGKKSTYTKTDDKLSLFTFIFAHVQLLIGIVMYVLSPLVKTFWKNPGDMMGESLYRFFGIEHILGMLIAIALITIGRIKVKKTAMAEKKHFKTALFFGFALLIILLTIPWPFRGFGHGWF